MTAPNERRLQEIATALLEEIGEDPTRDGLIDTPKRFARWWVDFATFDAGNSETVFETKVTGELIVVSGVRVWSLCEHHLLPFSCTLSVAYKAEGQLIGLSKVARIAQKFAHRLQVQERLVADIADELQSILNVSDVAVLGAGLHLCMAMRGVRSLASAKTTAYRGVFSTSYEARAEFLSMVQMDRSNLPGLD